MDELRQRGHDPKGNDEWDDVWLLCRGQKPFAPIRE